MPRGRVLEQTDRGLNVIDLPHLQAPLVGAGAGNAGQGDGIVTAAKNGIPI